MPDAENPKPKESEEIEDPKAPTQVSIEEYNQLADAYLDELVTKLEGEAEKNPKLDVEYSVCIHLLPELVEKVRLLTNFAGGRT